MQTDKRSRAQQLANELQRSNNEDVLNIRELVALRLELAKDSLLTEQGEELIRAQGSAQALNKLLVSLTVAPPQTRRTGE